jgi:membrane-associated phospholipid phosphatase
MPERARMALAAALACGALLVVTWYATFHIGMFEHADRAILRGFVGLGQRPRVSSTALFIAHLCDPKPYVYFCAVPVVVALLRRRFVLATAICAILLGANVTTHLLKPLLAVHRPALVEGLPHPPAGSSWPSGHATAAMALALCCVLAAPGRLRPFVAALGAAFAVAVSYSFLTLEWHYPGDVFGGFLIAAIWTLLGVAAVSAADARRTRSADAVTQRLTVREALGPPAAALIAAVLLAGLVALARPSEVVAYARLHEAFVLGAVAIGATGLALATGLLLALRR